MEEIKDALNLKAEILYVVYNRDLFSVCECKTDEEIPEDAICGIKGRGLRFIATGEGLCTNVGQSVILSGQWENHPKYGLQLKISDCSEYIGTGRKNIVAYLSSKILKGIGEKTANAIYDRFGDSSIEVIDSTPELLMEVPGIKKKKFKSIMGSYDKNRYLHAVSRLLSPHGVTYKTVVRICKKLGTSAAAMIRANPYCLCDTPYIGFKQADEIALKMGNFAKSPFRIRGAISYVLIEAQTNEGHVCLPRNTLLERCCTDKVLNNGHTEEVTIDDVIPVLEEMLDDETLHSVTCSSQDGNIIYIYTKESYNHESVAARAIAIKMAMRLQEQDWETIVTKTAEKLDVTLDEIQFAAVVKSLGAPISVITGGPGTGKTTSLKVLVASYESAYPNRKVKTIQLAAPTGRAARRMSDQSGKKAMTLHSMLGLKPEQHTDFSMIPSAEEMVNTDLLVIDEASMIDAHLIAELMYRVPGKTQILFLGDIDQLPSVGAGNVLRQLLSCSMIPYTKLERIFRQENGSPIPVNAANIKNGINILQENRYFQIHRVTDEEEGALLISGLMNRCISKGKVNDTQILCPMKKRGATGTYNLNASLRDIINPPAYGKRETKIGDSTFRVGDKVIQTKNIKDVSNGDIGCIKWIATKNKKGEHEVKIGVFFESCDKVVEYTYEDALELELAYAITIHKSQGSEFPAVIIPVFSSMYFMLRRNLLYTAVTRAKLQVIIVTDIRAAGVAMAIRTEDSSKRHTLLSYMIENFSNSNILSSETPKENTLE